MKIINPDSIIQNLEIDFLNQKILISDQLVLQNEKLLLERNVEIKELQQQIIVKNIKINELENKILFLNEKNSLLVNSNSWKITKPLRSFKYKIALLLKIFCNLKLLTSNIKLKEKNLEDTNNQINNKNLIINKIFDKNNFLDWVHNYDLMTEEKIITIKTLIKNFDTSPKISILMPICNPNIAFLIESIQSVQKQLYYNWELCIADDASTDKNVKLILQQIAKDYGRIKLVFREFTGGMAATSNSAITLATGDWLTLFFCNDLLPQDALFWIANAISKKSDLGLIYSDECTIDTSGIRTEHYFKCDWNYDLFLSHNMIGHLSAYRKDLVQQIAGFKLDFEGGEDYDLSLRIIELLEPNQIKHIPRILYHRRKNLNNTSNDVYIKSNIVKSGIKSIQNHFDRRKIEAKVTYNNFQQYRVHYNLPENSPLVTIIIPTRNCLMLIQQCILSILKKTTYSNYEILVIDNASDDPDIFEYFSKISKLNNVKVLRDERPFNYSALNNHAVKNSNGEYVLLLNNDTEVINPEWLSEMVSIAIQPGVGAVGARLWYPNNTLQHGGVIIGIGGIAGHSHKYLAKGLSGYMNRANAIQHLSAVTAACLLVSKKIYEEIGGLDEINLTVAYNDVDFCLEVTNRGYRNIWTPYAELYHYESLSRGAEDTPEKLQRAALEIGFMKSKWNTKLHEDPFYSLNLTMESEDFSLAWPPRITLND